jgi:AcrR family transcriptional regulator
MATTADDLRRVALEEFATAGYLGTSLQQIADRAGVSKATVLYHFASKEVLLEAVLSPALDQLDGILGLGGLAGLQGGGEARTQFIERFVDFLIEHRSAAYIFVNQASSLVDIPVVERANAEIELISRYFEENVGSVEDKVRFGVALGGAAYLLAGAPVSMLGPELTGLRDALITVLGELLAPSSLSRSTATD